MKGISRSLGVRMLLAATLALGIGACSRNVADGPLAGIGVGGSGGDGDGDGTSNGRGGRAVPGSQQDFAQNVGDRVFFETDSTELTAKAQSTLDRQAAWLNQYSRYAFTVAGHADERGTREYNFALGARRADVVKNYLSSHGVSAGRIRTTSYGKERPVAVCNDISCWSQNRRAVTLLNAGTS